MCMTVATRTGFLEERAGAGVSVGSLVVMQVEAFPHLHLPIHSAKFTAAFSVPQRAHGPVHKVQHNMIQDEAKEAWRGVGGRAHTGQELGSQDRQPGGGKGSYG